MPVTFINDTGTVGIIFQAFTNNITGSPFLSLLFLCFIILALFVAFRIPIEFSLILMLPMFLIFLAFSHEFLPIVGVILIYLGVLWGKNMITNQ
jgi:hypothetical protein